MLPVVKRILPAVFILVLLYSCKKDKIPYSKISGEWKLSKTAVIYFPPDTQKNVIVIAREPNVEILNFNHDGSGESNGGLGGFTYSLNTLKFFYARTGYYEHWNMALNADTLTLTKETAGPPKSETVNYYIKIK